MMKNEIRRKAIERHIRRIEKRIQALEAARNRFARYRPVIFFVGIALTYWWGWTPFIIAVVIMSVEALYYHRIGSVMNRHQIWQNIKSAQLARMALDWNNIPEPPLASFDENHPFEIDLNISGRCSLHHLINMAISRQGSQRLREWLLQTRPNLQRIQERQEIIRELVPLSRFRDKLLLNFYLVSKEHLDSEKLLHWLQLHSPSNALQRILPLSIGLAIINIGLFAGYILNWIPGYWIISLALYLAVYFVYAPALKKNFDALMLLDDELSKFKVVLKYLETYPYGNNTHLKELCHSFWNSNGLPSVLLRKITWLTTAVGLRMNPLLGLFLNIVVPWDLYFGSRIEHCKTQCAGQFPEWVHAWSELEALVSLANFSYLHPEYTFPEIFPEKEQGRQPILQAAELGHPLIPAAQRVCNDFSLQQLGEITLLTGSNMAGKSTFLKTVGINLCLAYAGGPVNAAALQTTLFRVFTCIQIHDSITDGFSFFYAEVKRLKSILNALHADDQIPVLFLIDEIFKGTNSRERLIGGRAYIHHLSHQLGAGMIATHDLELGQLAEQIPGLKNAHFRDDVRDGTMIFDYKLRPGVCPTTNALKIMKIEGLPIDV